MIDCLFSTMNVKYEHTQFLYLLKAPKSKHIYNFKSKSFFIAEMVETYNSKTMKGELKIMTVNDTARSFVKYLNLK